MRWCRFGTDFFVCDCEKRKMYWMYIEFFGKKQAGKDVPKMCHRINQRFLNAERYLPVKKEKLRGNRLWAGFGVLSVWCRKRGSNPHGIATTGF